MSGGKETGRQKMIGMMYLFLTALLALNVSKEIIDAFVIINKGIEVTNSNFYSKIRMQYAIFKSELEKNPGKVKPYFDEAQIIKKEAATVMTYIQELKGRVCSQAQYGTEDKFQEFIGKDQNGQDTLAYMIKFDKKDDYDTPTHMLIGDDTHSPKSGPWSALELKGKLTKFKEVVKKACAKDKEKLKRFDEVFAFKEGYTFDDIKEEWEIINFNHSPVVATIAILSKLQTDVRNSESEALDYLLYEINAASFKFDKLVPLVRVKSSYVAVGDSLVATIGVGAYDESKSPVITVNGQNVPVKDGVGYLNQRPTTVGDQVWKGIIKLEGPKGTETLDFEVPFKVAASSDAVIDPAKMNVFYAGVENPLNVSVAGVDSDNLTVTSSTSKVKIKKAANGTYAAIMDGQFKNNEEVEISVAGKTLTGMQKSFGKKKFRVKNLPQPIALISGRGATDKIITIADLSSASRMVAVLPDFLFDGVKMKVTGFKMVVNAAGGDIGFVSNSEELTTEQKTQIGKMRSKQGIAFQDIKAVGPDGRVQLCPNLTFKIQ